MALKRSMPDRMGRFNPEKLTREPDDVYHSKRSQYVTSHSLADFEKSPAVFKAKRDGTIPSESSSSFEFGTAAHVYILEGEEAFQRLYDVGGPINETTGKPYGKTTKKYKEWADSNEKKVLSDSDLAKIESMSLSVENHGAASNLLYGGVAERVARATVEGVPCQSKIDYAYPRREHELAGLVDYKTCYDLDAFEGQIAEYGYAKQLAFYRMMAGEVCGAKPGECAIIATEKQSPFRTGVWFIDEATLDEAEKEIRETLRKVATSFESDEWPTGYERPRVYKGE